MQILSKDTNKNVKPTGIELALSVSVSQMPDTQWHQLQAHNSVIAFLTLCLFIKWAL